MKNVTKGTEPQRWAIYYWRDVRGSRARRWVTWAVDQEQAALLFEEALRAEPGDVVAGDPEPLPQEKLWPEVDSR